MPITFLLLKKRILVSFLLWGAVLAVNGQRVLTIDSAMDLAGENSPNLKRSFMNLERYQQILIAQRSSLKSKFALNLNPLTYSKTRRFDNRFSEWYTNQTLASNGTFRVDQPILMTDGTVSLINSFGWQDNNSDINGVKTSNKAFSNELYLQLTQPIFTYNRRKMELKQIEYDLENANISYALQRLNTEQQITNQFYAVYMGQNNLEISEEELANAKQSYEIIKNKVEADLAARDELFQAEVNLATAQSSRDERAVALENAKEQLNKTLGVAIDEDIAVVAEVKIKPVEVDLEKAIRYGLMGDNRNFGRMYDNPTQNPRILVSLTVPIFDWGEKKARIRAQKVAQQINQLNTKEDKVDIELNIRHTWRSLENLKTQIKIAEQNVTNAQLTYDLNLIRYREGDITGMAISQFQSQLSSKKISYSQALINYKIELLNMKILSLYDFEKNEPIVPLNEINLIK